MTEEKISIVGLSVSRRRWCALMFVLLVFVCGGIYGFLYEELFYRIDLGYFVKRGTTLGPWIPIYAVGCLLLLPITNRLKNRPWLLLLAGGAVCGTLELTAGFLLDRLGGVRLWDYNTEIWNWGNLGGYICFRSVAFFALSTLVLLYGILPFARAIERRLSFRAFSALSLSLSGLFLLDILCSSVLHLF